MFFGRASLRPVVTGEARYTSVVTSGVSSKHVIESLYSPNFDSVGAEFVTIARNDDGGEVFFAVFDLEVVAF